MAELNVKLAKTKLEALVAEALGPVRIAEIAVRNADQALYSDNQEIFMAWMQVHRARVELEGAISFLRRKAR